MEEKFTNKLSIDRGAPDAVFTEIKGPCFICKTECAETSWNLNLNCWVWICSEECLACKNNPEAYEIIKQQIQKEFKKVLQENIDKTFLPKGYTDEPIRHP